MTVKFAINALLVATIAALCAGVPIAVLLTWGLEANLRLEQAMRLLSISAVGSLIIGLPIAFLTFSRIRNDRSFRFGKLLTLANLVALILAFLMFLTWGPFGAVFYGLPTLIAANAFAISGWIIVLRPARAIA